MTAVTPGWYPDPWQQAPLRYWGGSAWTAALSHSSSQQQTNAAFACPDSGAGQHQMPSSQPITSQQKGAALEQQIAAFLRTNGYETQTNVVLTGRSGAPHELDVLGVKHDQLTPFRVAVECKAWERPIEKDVVAKFAYVLGDIGIREGIIACLAGYRSGAETAAIEMGITLWGADELSSRLGRVVLGDLSTRAPQHVASGLPFTLSMEQARPLIERETKGRLGFGGEEIVWMSPVWLPVAVTQIAVSQLEGRIKKVMQTRRVWNAYELIDGELVWSFAAAPALSEVDLAKRSIRPKRKQTAVLRSVSEAVSKYKSVSTEPARARHAARLAKLGIPAPYNAVAESARMAFFPLYVAIVRRRDGERVVAVDGLNRIVAPTLGAALSRNIHWLRESL